MHKIIISALIIGSFFSISSVVDAKVKTASTYGATALCKDGTYSYSANHRGTCSHHRGVKVWYK